MKEFKIYLAGGMGSLTWAEQTEWREKVEDLLYRSYDIFKYKLDIINPTDYYNFKEKFHDSELEILKFDIRHVKTSDLIIVCYNDPKSIGTAQEIAIAYELDIPIIGINQGKELHPWLECMTDKIFDNVEDCVKYVSDFYLI